MTCAHVKRGETCSVAGCRNAWPRQLVRDSGSVAEALDQLHFVVDDANLPFALAEFVDECILQTRRWTAGIPIEDRK